MDAGPTNSTTAGSSNPPSSPTSKPATPSPKKKSSDPFCRSSPYTDEAEALTIANHSDYGLGGSIWTADPERGAQFARNIASGTIGINATPTTPPPPFGGIKNSGLGRELGPEGLASYQQLKSIYLDVR